MRHYAAIGLLLLVAGASRGETLDQEYWPGPFSLSQSASAYDLAQSFTPSTDRVDAVLVAFGCCINGGSLTLTLHIREGSVNGPILGSQTRFLNTYNNGEQRFEFTPPVPVTPGQLYVIDMVHEGGSNGMWGSNGAGPPYVRGNKIINGIEKPFDFGFRTFGPQTMQNGPTPLEYSNHWDERSIAGGGEHYDPDPGQVLYAEPPDTETDSFPVDIFDIDPGLESGFEPDSQVDALSNGDDVLFTMLDNNQANLLVSFTGDAIFSEIAAYAETPAGTTSIHWYQANINAPDPATTTLEDVDAMELWGPVGSDDANFYSLNTDHAVGGSIFHRLGPTPTVYLDQPSVVAAITALGWNGVAEEVDIDALMMQDVGRVGYLEGDDVVLFSIKPNGNFDGGEIIRLPATGAPSFFSHGGHVWDTAFPTAFTFGEPSGIEDIDGLEAHFEITASASAPTASQGLRLALLVALLGTGALTLQGRGRGSPRVLGHHSRLSR